MKKLYILVCLPAVMLLATGCFIIETGKQGTPGSSPASRPAELAIVKHNITTSDTGAEVSVTIKNVGPSTAELAEVRVEFNDANGNLISTATDAVMNLEAGELWDFKLSCAGANCGQVKTYEVTATATSNP